MRIPRLSVTTGIVALFSTVAPTQIPDGWMLTGCYRYLGTLPCPIAGFGGIHALDPRAGTVMPITGVPPEVLGTVPASTFLHGADFAIRVPDTDLVVTNGWGDSTFGQQMPVYVLQLAGLQVVWGTRYDVGQLAAAPWGSAGLPQARALADGRVVMAVDPTTFAVGEALASTWLAILDTALQPAHPSALTTVPMGPLPSGSPNAMALDLDQGTAWIGVFDHPNSTIYRVDFPQGGTPTTVLTMPNQLITGLALQSDGGLLATSNSVVNDAAKLLRLPPNQPAAVTFPQVTSLYFAEGLRIEPATGDIFLIAGSTCDRRDVYRIAPADPATGAISTAVPQPAAGWGVPSSLDLDPDPEVYGTASGVALDVHWQVAPNAGGLPRVGNTSFGLELAAPVPPAVAGVLFGFARGPAPSHPTLNLLLAPVISMVLLPATTMAVPLGIPNSGSLAGLRIHAQCVFADASLGLGASAGALLTVLP
ncbi:MAG: hypothetical protein KDC98_20680 [Planctomycetes bacterium]|nr:hypothetical protein [Planctomycetota bacterium]